MFKKILIANRGEIACRIMRTARRLGVQVVAVYSDADAQSLHVALADEAYRIGAAPVAESYLQMDRIIAAGLASGAGAIHPGYGFLSENAGFADAVTKAGLRFIGPSAAAIRAMGLKDAAKSLMERSGVPIVPGYHGSEQDPTFLAARAAEIGYPVLIKARAGGGGKGMRRVDHPKDFTAALQGAQREGKASFGDDRVLIEKYLTKPRHIEIQVFGDDHGNAIHLFERDCSLQRRHQKVIEEAPAPGMSAEMRAQMGAAAVCAAQAIAYSGAGTVEFIADVADGLRTDRFYFMEMNTRLQVEHPVTELITGLDLVEWQLRVACGENLPLRQSDLAIDGWAFEARIYAEDAAKGFLPATGCLQYLDLPREENGVRIDTGVRQGDDITPFYDPMIAKLIVHGPTRRAALNKLSMALARTHVAGTVTNIGFLSRLAANAEFVRGDLDTGIIERNLPALIATSEPSPEVLGIAALAALGLIRARIGVDPWDTLTGWRLWSTAKHFALLEWNGEALDIRVTSSAPAAFEISTPHGAMSILIVSTQADHVRFNVDGRISSMAFIEHGRHVTVFADRQIHRFGLPDRLTEAEEDEAGGDKVISPMPGLIKLVSTAPGAEVKRGDALIVVEAMKMEHTMTAPRDGRVAELLVRTGEQVQDGAILLTLEPEAS